jgi:RecA/RadA recombinase
MSLRDVLKKAGLSNEVINKVEELKIEDVVQMTEEELSKKLSISRKDARKIIDSLMEGRIGFKTALDVMKTPETRISTGVRSIDNILKGGIKIGSITELYGKAGTGKSQFCFQMSVIATDLGKVIYIDTERGFSPSRLSDISTRFEKDPSTVLSKILVFRPDSINGLRASIRSARELARKGEVSLVVVDSLLSIFRSEYVGLEMLAERQRQLSLVLKILREISNMGTTVMFTNHVIGRISESFEDLAAGGYIVGHFPDLVLWIRKGSGSTRILKIVDSSELPEAEAVFVITKGGLEDI